MIRAPVRFVVLGGPGEEVARIERALRALGATVAPAGRTAAGAGVGPGGAAAGAGAGAGVGVGAGVGAGSVGSTGAVGSAETDRVGSAGDGGSAWAASPDVVVLAGGQTVADAAVRAALVFAERGGPILAVGQGVRLACELGLLEGRVEPADGNAARAAASGPPNPVGFGPVPGHVRVEGRPTPFTWALPAGRILQVQPAVTPPLRLVHPDADRLAGDGRVVLRFATEDGGEHPAGLAGLANPEGRVVGVLAAVDRLGGRLLLECALAAVRGVPTRVGG